MEKDYNKTRFICVILFWGSLWGIIEATIGLVLHMLPFKVPTGSVLFPIGYYFMQKSYRENNDIKSMVYTSLVAASIKLVNLLSPAVPVLRVLNPASCIVLEGLGVFLVFKYIIKEENMIKFTHILSMSTIWRIGYYIMCLVVFVPLGMMESGSILGINKIVEFFIKNGLINSILIYLYIKVQSKHNKKSNIKYHPVLSSSIFIIAIMITWLL